MTQSQLSIVALCKTFAGEEWIVPMTLSIYPFISKIVFVNSEISWTGRKGNTCRESIEFMKKEIDTDDKIISLNCDTIDQNTQCSFGYNYIKEHIHCDFVMLIDTDEIWDEYNLKEAIKFLEGNLEHSAYRIQMNTYIKTPYIKITPREQLEPVVFIKSNLDDMGKDARACGLKFTRMTDSLGKKIFLHHFVYVRKDFNTVLEKIISSHVTENVFYEDMSVWIPEVWNKLPIVKRMDGFHPAIGYTKNWIGTELILLEDLPEILRNGNFPIMRQFKNELQ